MGIFKDIPNDILADERRKIDADNWAMVQRRQLADEWAQEQRRILGLTGVPTPIPSQTDVYTGLRQAQSTGIAVPETAAPEQPDAMSQAWQGFNERVIDPPRSALQYTLDVLSRPNYASAGVASEIVKPTTKPDAGILDRTGAVLEAGRKGIMGEQRKQYSDVLGEAGMEPGRTRDVLGFVGDVALDPTTYLTLGAGAGAKAGLKAGIPFTKAETTLVKGDPLKAIVNAASAVADRVPGGSALKDIAGETFVSDYGLKKAGYGKFAEQMAETRRMPRIAKQEATAIVRKHLSPLTEDQRTEFFRLADQSLKESLGKVGATSADIEDDAVRTAYEWYRGEHAPMVKQMKEQMGLTSFLDDYIRHVFPEKVKPKEVAIGRPPTVRDPGSFKHRAGAEGFTEDPRIALGFDYADTVTRKATNDLVNTATTRYGQKLKPKQEVPEGYKEYFPKGNLNFYPVTDAAGKKHIATRKGQRVALPEPIAQALETLTSPKDTMGLLKAYDTVQNVWKASVTSYFPEFHARNMLGNFYNNWLAGIYDPRAYLQASKMQQATRTGDFSKLRAIGGVDPKTLYTEMQKSGVVNSGFYGGEIIEQLTSTGQNRSKIMQALSAGRTVGEALENNAKIAHVIGQLDKGMALPDALRSAKKYLFDYTDLTPAEKGVFRRFVPFYTWTRKNIPLQIESIIREPRKPLLVEKAREGLSQEENYRTEMELAPNYVAEQLNIVTDKDEQGNLHVLSGLGLPLEDLNRFFKVTPKRTLDQLASMASPLIRIPVETMSNHSFFTGKPIDDDATNNYYKRANSVLNAVPGLRDWLEIKSRPYKDAKTGEERTAYTADPMKNYIFLSVMGRVATTAGKFASEQRSIPGAIAEITLPGKDYIVDPARSQVPFTEKMVASQDKKASDLDKIAREFFAGKYSGAEAREVRSRALGEAGKEMSMLREQTAAKEAEYIPNIDAKEKLRQQMLPENEKLLAEYYDIQPETTEPIGGFIKRLDEFKAKLTPEQQKTFDAAQEKQLAELEKRSPLAAKMERDYRQGIEEYRNYREIEEMSGLSRNILDLAAEFAQQKRDTARSAPGADSKKIEAVVASVNPDGALAYKAKQMFDKSAKGKKLKEIRQSYWASRPALQRWFSDSVLAEEG